MFTINHIVMIFTSNYNSMTIFDSSKNVLFSVCVFFLIRLTILVMLEYG